MQTLIRMGIRWAVTALMTWLRVRASIREAAERFTLRLSGWRLVCWTALMAVLALLFYGSIWAVTFQTIDGLLNHLPGVFLVHLVAFVLTAGWAVIPLMRRLLARRAPSVCIYELLVHDEDWLFVDSHLTLGIPDERVLAEAKQVAIRLIKEQAEDEDITVDDLDVDIHAFAIPARAFGRALATEDTR